ncbi:MAG: DUF4440 domain-containing protein [Vicinamibacterales bacterium]
MRRSLAFVFAFTAAVGLAACGGSAPADQFERTDAEQISTMVQEFAAAYNAKDVEKIGTYFAGNASLMPANRSTLNGVDSIKGFYKDRVEVDGATDLNIEMLSVQGHGPLAYFAGTFSLNIKPPDGSAENRDRGKVIWILRRSGGQWRFEYQIMSSDLPPAIPAEPAPAAK